MENQLYTYQFKTQALEEHERLSRLYKENRFMFELERKEMLERNINRIQKKNLRKDLEEMQGQWDRIMKNAGSPHNRFVLMQTLLWDAVQNQWLPALHK